MTIYPLLNVPTNLLNDFDCGNEELNKYLKNYAIQNNKNNISKTFILFDNNHIIGYYSLSTAQINFQEINDEMKKGLPRYPIPSIRLARLAISKDEHRHGYGSALLKDAFLRILDISKQTGIYFIIVDAKKQAVPFYEHFGFIKLNSFESTYVLPLSTIKKAYDLSKIK